MNSIDIFYKVDIEIEIEIDTPNEQTITRLTNR